MQKVMIEFFALHLLAAAASKLLNYLLLMALATRSVYLLLSKSNFLQSAGDLTTKKKKLVQIFIKGQKKPFVINLYNSVSVLKKEISKRIGLDVSDQYLTFSGKQLANEKTLLDYNVQFHLTLFLSGQIMGGAVANKKTAGKRRMHSPRPPASYSIEAVKRYGACLARGINDTHDIPLLNKQTFKAF